MKKTSKRKLFYPAVFEQSENNALPIKINGEDDRNLKSTEDVSTTVTPKHRVQLTERQQMSILLQLTANAPHNIVGLSPRTTRPPLKAVKGQRRAVKRGRLLHKRNERGETLLHLAAIRGDTKQVHRLVRLGADVNCPDFAGWTPLHEACNHGWFRVGQLLLKAGADVDARGFDDFTPLHDAAVNGHLDLVELLLQHGASRSPTNVNGKTPLNLTTCSRIADVLRKPEVAVEFCAAARDDAGGACSRKDEEQLTSPSVSTASAIPNNMRKSSPQHQTPKGPDKPSSPRLTLRFQPIKSRDERHGAAATAASGGVGGSGGGGGGGSGASGCGLSSKASEVTSSEPRYQSYCVTMETAEEDDVYEFKKDPNEESVPPPMSSSSVAHHRPSSSATSTSSVTAAATVAVASSDDHVDQQFNVVSSTKDATLRIQQTNIDSAPNNNNNSSSSNNNRAKMNENHVIRAASASGASDLKQHKVDSHDVDATATAKVVIKNNVENTNHSRSTVAATAAAATDHHEAGAEGSGGEHDDGKRKRKRDAKDESTANKNGGSGAVAGGGGGGGGMSLRNHGRDKSSPEERKSPENSTATDSVENNAATKLHASGSETESTQSDAENEAPDGAPAASAASVNNQEQHAQQSAGLPKVPPLKIVIPPTSMAEQDRDRSRVASRHSLPYIVNSSEDSKGAGGGDGNGGNGAATTTTASNSQPLQSQPTVPLPTSTESKENAFPNHPVQTAAAAASTTKEDAKSKDGAGVHSEERWHRVTRSSQRMAAMAGSGGSAAAGGGGGGTTAVSLTASLQNLQDYVTGDCGGKASKFDEGAGSAEEHNGTEMPPRKRKLRPRGSDNGPNMDGNSASSASSSSSSSVSSHYEEQSMYLNCYEMFLNLRRQIDRRHTNMFVVQPKPPQGFKDYLMNKCSYVLAGNAASRLSVPMIPPPQSLNGLMKELYVAQEKARYSLRLQHIIEREKLTLSFEQETLRVHGRAARAMANQSVPLSVCTILKDEEVYNQIEPEQEEKERNARTRFNGRLFLSWLQDVDDKWDKVKKAMLLRHHNEAESLNAAQKLDWEWKLKEVGICDTKSTPAIDVIHVPIVHVSDEFDLLPT